MSTFITGQKIFSRRKRCLINISIALTFSSILIFGCTPMLRQKPPSLTGTFSGSTQDGRSIRVTLLQEQNTVTGWGAIGEHPFSLSSLVSWHGPLILTFEDGTIYSAYISLSPDGAVTNISGTKISVTLQREGEPSQAPPGPFAGHFATSGPPPLWLILDQRGDLLAGTGFVNGKPVAVVGKVTAPNTATGTILFADESQNRVKATLSSDRRILTIEGLGSPLEMKRK